MRCEPALRALRSNPASQRMAQTAVERAKGNWRDDDEHSAIHEGLTQDGEGGDLARCPALDHLFPEPEKSAEFVDRLLGKLVPELASHPLAQISFPHQYGGAMAIIQLAAAGEAAISLLLSDRRASAASPHTVCFTDSERHEIALSGAGSLQIVWRDKGSGELARLHCRQVTLGPGQCLSLSGMCETKLIELVDDRLVILRLSRSAPAPQRSLEYRLSDGRWSIRGLAKRATAAMK